MLQILQAVAVSVRSNGMEDASIKESRGTTLYRLIPLYVL